MYRKILKWPHFRPNFQAIKPLGKVLLWYSLSVVQFILLNYTILDNPNMSGLKGSPLFTLI